MIKISIKGLAKFMTAGPAGQRKVLRDFKHPDPEGHAQATYYREACDLVVSFHQHDHPRSWLNDRAGVLRGLAAVSTGQTRVRLQHNARALEGYSDHFGGKTLEILPGVKLDVRFGSVLITVRPDLHFSEGGREKIAKLEFSSREPDPRVPRIVCQVLLEAATEHGLGLSSSDVLYLDVPRGDVYKVARVGSRLSREINAACENITAIWEGV